MAENVQITAEKYPRRTLEDSISLSLELVKKMPRGGFPFLGAALAIGYKKVSGATKNSFAAMRLYGLVRGRGTIQLTEDLIRLSTTVGDKERLDICQRLALLPPLLRRLHGEGVNPADETLARRWLIINGFNEVEAASIAKIYRKNATFARLDSPSNSSFQLPLSGEIRPQHRPAPIELPQPVAQPQGEEFHFPLLTCECSVLLRNKNYSSDDIKLLIQYLQLVETSKRSRHGENPPV